MPALDPSMRPGHGGRGLPARRAFVVAVGLLLALSTLATVTPALGRETLPRPDPSAPALVQAPHAEDDVDVAAGDHEAPPLLRLPAGLTLQDVSILPAKDAPAPRSGGSPAAPALPLFEPDDPECTYELTPPARCQGELRYSKYQNSGNDRRWFNVQPGPWVTLDATLEAPEGAIFEICVGSDTRHCATATAGQPARLAREVGDSGRSSIYVVTLEGSGTFRLHVAALAWDLAPDCGSGADASGASADAMPLPVPHACEGSLNPKDDAHDWYALTLPSGSGASVSLAPNAHSDFDLCAYAAEDPSRALDCALRPQGLEDRTYLAGPGTFLLDVHHWSGAGAYAVSVAAAPAQDDCGTGTDGGSRYRTLTLALPVACVGSLAPTLGDLWDLYAFNATGMGGIRVRMTPEGADHDVCLYPPGSNSPVQCSFPQGAGEVAYSATRAGVWLVSVLGFSGEDGAYALSVEEFATAPQDDCGSARDAGAGVTLPVAIAPTFSCQGVLSSADGDWADAYEFSMPPSNLTVVLHPDEPGAWGLCLVSFGIMDCAAPDADGAYRLGRETFGDGTYRVVAYRLDHPTNGAYALSLHAAPPKSDCGSGGDASTYPDMGAWLTLPQVRCEGTLHGKWRDTVDSFRFHVRPGESLLIEVDVDENEDGRFHGICLHQEGMVGQYCSLDCRPACGSTEHDMWILDPAPGEWRLSILSPHWPILPEGDLPYRVTVLTTPTPPLV